jgi:solute carrier family 35, member F5
MIDLEYGLGLFFIFIVTVIWSGSSIVVQFLYTDEKFDSPFLLTYIGTSLFILFIPSRLIWERRNTICTPNSQNNSEVDNDDIVIPWRTNDETYEQLSTTPSFDEDGGVVRVDISPRSRIELLSHWQHFQIAMRIAPIWFISNFAYNASLKFTSITSSTVLASTGSLFTFLFAIITKDETFSLAKFIGVLFGVLGSTITGISDVGTKNDANSSWNVTDSFRNNDHNNNSTDPAILGDLLGLISAVGYGTYTVMIRVLCPRNEDHYSMQLLLGYIGLINGVFLMPVMIYVVALDTSSTIMENMTWIILAYLIAKGLLDNVLSDYLWARAVVLTSATVATVGLGLTIPLAFFSDCFMGHSDVINLQSIGGAISVLIGFTLVNIGCNHSIDGDVVDEVTDTANQNDESANIECTEQQ